MTRRRTFPPLPVGAGPRAGHGGSSSGPDRADRAGRPDRSTRPARSRGLFAESWWGNAWVEALEETSLDPGRLSRGRTYARGGYVDTITVTPGRIAAMVRGSRPRPYRTEVSLPVLSDRAWDSFLDTVATEPAHIAALLDKDMPHALVEAAETAGVQLLPGRGELVPGCSCPDHGDPCKHAAALCYQTARLLDADPFVLLLLRGRDETELLDELGRRNAARAARERSARAEPDVAAVSAREALSVPDRPPLPAPLPPPAGPDHPPLFPEVDGGPDSSALEFLAIDAASRAQTFLTTGAGPFGSSSSASAPLPSASSAVSSIASAPFGSPSTWHDAVRLAATHPHLTGRRSFSPLFSSLAAGTDHTPQDLARAAAAWRQGGPEGLAVLETPWDPPAGDFDRARSALAAADFPRMTIWRNHLTDPSRAIQLRYGRDGRWYPYRSDEGRDDWWPEGSPDEDPVGALTGTLDG
ncbi:SWIM zinc finger family protein [Streptomyces sp. NPDC004647]|uniref:SWIM zinc finger family protein n=1 Tax=Streptomyces sp. NPDC004647 TaxID=3154671 RepID=UPI0033B6BEF4